MMVMLMSLNCIFTDLLDVQLQNYVHGDFIHSNNCCTFSGFVLKLQSVTLCVPAASQGTHTLFFSFPLSLFKVSRSVCVKRGL